MDIITDNPMKKADIVAALNEGRVDEDEVRPDRVKKLLQRAKDRGLVVLEGELWKRQRGLRRGHVRPIGVHMCPRFAVLDEGTQRGQVSGTPPRSAGTERGQIPGTIRRSAKTGTGDSSGDTSGDRHDLRHRLLLDRPEGSA